MDDSQTLPSDVEPRCPFQSPASSSYRSVRGYAHCHSLAVDERCNTEEHEECPCYLTRILTRSRPGIRRSDPCLWSK